MLLPPINFIFKLLQQHSIVQIWLYEQVGSTASLAISVSMLTSHSRIQLAIRIEGKIRGFDEFMNLVVSIPPNYTDASGLT